MPHSAVQYIASRYDGLPIDTAVILGSGLQGIAAALLSNPVKISYCDIPGFPQAPLVEGHVGELHLGTIGVHRIGIFLGRNHLYQGLSAREIVFPIRLAAALGAEEMLITNAAGSLGEESHPGELMLISDQINLTGETPLDPKNPIHTGSPFVSMADAYSPRLRTEAQWAAKSRHLHLTEGVYVGVRGPQYETPAEAHYLHSIGGNAVGMSTVLETIAARALGMKILGLSLLTNRAGAKDTHKNVLKAAAEAQEALSSLLGTYLHHETIQDD